MTPPETARVPRTAPDLGIPSRAWLVAVLTVLAAATTSSGVLAPAPGGAPAVATLVVPVLAGLGAALVLRRPGAAVPGVPDARQVLVAALAAVVVAVPALLATGAPAVALTVVALVATLAALPLAVVHAAARAGGGRQAAAGLLLGAGLWTVLGAGLRGTGDGPAPDLGADPWTAPFWYGVALVTLAASAVAAAVGTGRADAVADATPAGRPRRTWVVGPAVLVLDLVLADASAAASAAQVAPGVAGLVLVLASSAGVWLLLRPDPWPPAARVVAAGAVPAGVVGSTVLTGVAALAAAAVGLVAAGMVLASALSAHRPAPPGIRRTALAVGAVAASALAPWLLVALGLDATGVVLAVVPCAALAVGAAGLRRRTPDPVGEAPAGRSAAVARIPARVNPVRLLLLPALALALVQAVAGADEPPPPRWYLAP